MARGSVLLRLPGDADDDHANEWKTDLTGHGSVCVGEEFTAREVTRWGPPRKLRVRVVRVEKRGRSYHIVHVEILKDLTPPSTEVEPLF